VPLRRRVESTLETLHGGRKGHEPLDVHLTPRERQVIAELAEGHRNQIIARRLGISSNTVANHLHHILAKTGARSRTEALAVARRLGLVP
jgi:two-component system response regulator DesR